MVKFFCLSDIHGEFDRSSGIYWDFTPEPDSFYFCAGDIHSWYNLKMDFVNRHADHMFWIDGNHDFYGNKFQAANSMKTATVDGLKIAGATLWTDLSDKANWTLYVNGLSDARHIHGLTYETYNERHNEHLNFLLNSDADIWVTHHCPTLKSIDPKFAGSNLNCCFSNDLEDVIVNMKHPPRLIISGHTHCSYAYTLSNGTGCVCWPRGYPGENWYYEEYEPKEIEI